MTTEVKPLPPKEALEFWRDKVRLGPGEYRRLSAEAKLRAFSVSGVARGAELETVYDALHKSLAEGTTFEQFKADAREVFARRGWDENAPWRIETIFRNNIQQAYSVGRYQQMERVKQARPYWMYSAVNDGQTRLHHRAMDGKVYPADHPFWDSWYPPNGHRCRCTVITLTERQVKARGLTVEQRDPTGRLFEPVDPLTGVRHPARPLLPDPGFAYHPGKVGAAAQAQGVQRYADQADLKGPADYGRRSLENARAQDIADFAPQSFLAPGLSDEQYRAEFVARYGADGRVVRDALGDPVRVDMRAFLIDKSKGDVAGNRKFVKAGHGEIIPALEQMLREPYEVWVTPQVSEDTGRVRLTTRYVGLWKTADKQRIAGMAVMEVSGGELMGVTAFAPQKKGAPDMDYAERQRAGVLIYPKKK